MARATSFLRFPTEEKHGRAVLTIADTPMAWTIGASLNAAPASWPGDARSALRHNQKTGTKKSNKTAQPRVIILNFRIF